MVSRERAEQQVTLILGGVLVPVLLVSIPALKETLGLGDAFARGEGLALAGASLSTMVVLAIVRFGRGGGNIRDALHLALVLLLLSLCISVLGARLGDDGAFNSLDVNLLGRDVDAGVLLICGCIALGLLMPLRPEPDTRNAKIEEDELDANPPSGATV